MEKQTPNEQISAKQEKLQGESIFYISAKMREYNDQHSTGSMMGEALRGFAKTHVGDEEDEYKNNEQPKKITAQEMRDELSVELATTGLALEAVKNKKQGIFTTDGEINPRELRINISNRENFISYLKQLNESQLDSATITALATVLHSLTTQLFYEYDPSDVEDDRMLELLGGLGPILKEYRRLDDGGKNNLSDSIESLETCYQGSQGGYARETINVYRKYGSFMRGKVDCFWMRSDTNPDRYLKDWSFAVETLKDVKKNPDAKLLFEAFREKLAESIAMVEKAIASDQSILARPQGKKWPRAMEEARRLFDEVR